LSKDDVEELKRLRADKWLGRATGPGAATGLHTQRDRRRDTIDRAVKVAFDKARGLHGSPRLLHDLREDG
jgi:putative transposase